MNSDKPLCPYCASKSELVKGSVIYPHRNDLYNLNFWLCAPCDAYVGCHKGTTNPLGRLANKELRSAKSEAHKFFDPLWHNSEKPRRHARNAAYSWLAEALGVPTQECHIGMFDVETCRRVVEICKNRLKDEQ